MPAPQLLRPTLTLVAASSAAQLLPLLLAPLLTRLYSPQHFGVYHLFAAVAANVAVVACLRYEFALPMARDDEEAIALRSLCLRILAGVLLLTAVGALAWTLAISALWPLWLPVAVGGLGLVSLATLNATRERRFRQLGMARVVQHGGAAGLQALFGWFQAGTVSLIAGLVLAACAAAALLRLPLSGSLQVARERWVEVARRHRDFPWLNTPHAFLGALQDTVAIALVAALAGPAAAGGWGLCMRVLKAPATLVGGALSQTLYPQLAEGARGATAAGREAVVRAIVVLALLVSPWVVLLWWLAPPLFVWVFGESWADAGALARALALYIGMHFVASPMGVVTMAWNAQAFALRLAIVGQLLFVSALAVGLVLGGINLGGWLVSIVMAVYFVCYFVRLATWPVPAVAR